ncbi:histidine phosphatase family protein [Brachybacterium sp. JB7]|uniref:Phosphohistidine phosphatase n=2 Tax=Brachybacterium alimentarium TaxID=47845 RepID=A0A2A3YEJ3_9MICO|nr:histidine phosphatase family protein [Brachybacterium sp. JB7]PCC38192.1 phosphohistidine phosphatase [Brachybacterium alimentarium]RCS66967.1 histidine phosphatase family protein [Brachybacterium sp. JB7]RCS78061.1 histidine phosphatase family protein [Brachybacterium alimentarium]RCS79849.1 histidine phosphatase family protein [Brachybacterium alimentarium]RCS88916.1 histidine phosphatase family protein [Brachybacterium alimentarium]
MTTSSSSSSSDPDSRLLLIMRHGKAESGSGQMDHERRLAERGEAQARLVGEYLESQHVLPARVLVSDAVRTVQTWEAAVSAMPGFEGTVTFHEDIYDGGVGDLLGLLREVGDEHRVVMVIGHEPTMAALISLLGGEDSDPGSIAQARIGMPTGGMGVLSGALDHWSDLGEDALTVHTVVRP